MDCILMIESSVNSLYVELYKLLKDYQSINLRKKCICIKTAPSQ